MWQMPAECRCLCGGQVAYKGMYRRGHAPAGTPCDPHGKQKAASAVNNAKVQKRALDENVRRISEMCKDEKVLTLEEAIKWAANIMEHVGDGFDTQAVTLEEFLGIDGSDQNPDDWGYSLYWGYTSRMLADEALCWLTMRGAAGQDADGEYTLNPGQLNRPVLLFSSSGLTTRRSP